MTPIKTIACLLLCLASLSLAACKKDNAEPSTTTYTATASEVSPTTGDRLNLALTGNPPNLVPFLAGDNAASTIAGSIYHSLLTYDANLNLVPQLAEKFTISNEGKTITFTLKPNLVFSDGSPLTSQDVSATFHTITNPNTQTPYADDYLRVKKFETPNENTIRITYATSFAPALASWASLPILPARIINASKDFNQTTLKDTPIGSGPYQLSKWRKNQDILLTASPNTWEKPYISQLYYRIIPDQSTQWLELKSNNLDMLDLQPLAYTRLISETWFTSNYKSYRYLSNAYTYFGFNLKNPIFTKKTRQAMSHAIDRHGLINGVLFGQGEPITSIFKPGTWAYNTQLVPYAYSPAKARQLLSEDGWKPGADGILTRGNQRLSFTLTTNQGNESRLKTAQILQKFFADVGIDMHIQVQEWSTFLTNTIKPRKFDAIMLGWTLPAEPDPYDVWHSSKTKPDEFNIISFNNPQVDELMEKSRTTFNQAERKKALDAMQAILHDEQPYLWLYAPYSLVAIHKRIQGPAPAPAGIGYNSVEWFVPKPWQLRPQLQP